jgi:hypothetical protein
MLIPSDVREAIAAANGSLYGIPGDPGRPSFDTACDTIRSWASDALMDDPMYDDEGPICYDFDEPPRTAEQKLRDLVGSELFPYVR